MLYYPFFDPVFHTPEALDPQIYLKLFLLLEDTVFVPAAHFLKLSPDSLLRFQETYPVMLRSQAIRTTYNSRFSSFSAYLCHKAAAGGQPLSLARPNIDLMMELFGADLLPGTGINQTAALFARQIESIANAPGRGTPELRDAAKAELDRKGYIEFEDMLRHIHALEQAGSISRQKRTSLILRLKNGYLQAGAEGSGMLVPRLGQRPTAPGRAELDSGCLLALLQNTHAISSAAELRFLSEHDLLDLKREPFYPKFLDAYSVLCRMEYGGQWCRAQKIALMHKWLHRFLCAGLDLSIAFCDSALEAMLFHIPAPMITLLSWTLGKVLGQLAWIPQAADRLAFLMGRGMDPLYAFVEYIKLHEPYLGE